MKNNFFRSHRKHTMQHKFFISLLIMSILLQLAGTASPNFGISKVSAVEDPQLIISKVYAEAGDSIELDIEIKNISAGSKLAGGEFTLELDPTVAKVTEVGKGKLLENFYLEHYISNSESAGYRVAFAGADGISGDSVLCRVCFDIVGKPGMSTPVKIINPIFNDENGKKFPVTAVDGNIDIVSDKIDVEAELVTTLDYLRQKVTDPQVDSISGEWAVLALARAGSKDDNRYDVYRDNLERFVLNNAYFLDSDTGKVVLDKNKYTENSRVILALTALGEDATNFAGYDFVSALTDKQGASNDYQAVWQGINGAIYALIALDTNDYLADLPEVRSYFLNYLDMNEKANGGWNLGGSSADPDITGMALQALAPYYKMGEENYNSIFTDVGAPSYENIVSSVEQAVAFLRETLEKKNGDYGTSEGAVQVLTALVSLDYDSTKDNNLIEKVLENLLEYRDTTGGFKHKLSGDVDQMATEQAAYGLVAYARYLDGANTLYDMSTAFDWGLTFISPNVDKTELCAAIEKADGLNKSDYTAASWADFKNALEVAKTVAGYETAAQIDIDNAKDALMEAIDALKEIVPETLPENQTIDVSFRLIGATLSDGDIDLADGDYKGSEYVTWIKTQYYTLDEGSTVYDLFQKAMSNAGLRSVGADNNYVKTIYAPSVLGGYKLSEFTNGKRSGWMYTLNGQHVGFGLEETTLKDGDEIIWHYVNDFAYEVSDWGGGDSQYPSLGDETYHNNWLKAEDESSEDTGPIRTNPFTDVMEKEWFYETVKYAVKNGLFEGTGETTFSPNRPMTRAMLVTVLYRLEGLPATTGTNNFTDVKDNDWYIDAVIWADSKGLVKGYGNGLFGTNDFVTREQIATIFYRYASNKGYDVTASADLNVYADAAEVSNWAKIAISWANAEGLIIGRTKVTLVPKGNSTRAEVAAVMMRFIESVVK